MNRKKKTGVFASAVKQAAVTPKPSANTAAPPTRNLLQDRLDSIAKHAASPKVVANQYLTDPENCVLWSGHNRLWDHLNEDNCADLIASFKAVGRQQVAAIARRRLGETPEFEVIAGARRLWVVSYLRERGHPDLKFLVQVKDDLTDDVAAFKAMEAENRGRSNLSAYEQGLSYQRMLAELFEGNQTRLAEAVGRDKATISRYLQVAELPREVVTAFTPINSLTFKGGGKLYALWRGANEAKRKRIIAEAEAITSEQRDARAAGKPSIPAALVMKRLVESGDRRNARTGIPVEVFGPAQKPHLEVKSLNQRAVLISIPMSSDATDEQLLEHFRNVLSKYRKPG